MPLKVEEEVVSQNARVRASIEHAFNLFTVATASWWPEAHRIGANPFAKIVIEPRAGGRWYEQDAAGKQTQWGTVLAWEQPGRILLSWNIGPDWQFNPDPARASEIEVRFTPVDKKTTLVELEHRKLDHHGDGWEQMRAMLDDAEGWQASLAAFARAAEAANSTKEK